MPYSEVSITGYNSNPPEDDGTQASSNEVSWAKHKTKIGDPLKTAIETTQTNITTIVTAIEADLIEAGTKMIFFQTAAPTGWTIDGDNNNKALRVVSSSGGGTGGTTAFTSVFTSRTIAQANLPSVNLSHSLAAANHTHTHTRFNSLQNSVQLSGASDNYCRNSTSGTTGGSGSLSVSGTVALGGSGTAMDFAVQYCDVIIATKD